ncbi:MAG: SDR family oxidoreductase [Planctomycetaceae bacterium]|nr:SDR family oxidoreductase [Planctomycetaceae bacterium]
MDDASRFADLTGKAAMVTGSSSGIGRAIALELARAGAAVGIHYANNRAGAEQTAELIQQAGGTVQIFSGDLAESSRHESLVDAVFNWRSDVSIWVNNAGVDLLTGGARSLPYLEKLNRLFAVDVRATVSLSRLAGARFRERGTGSIINIGWDQAERGMEGESGELFATAKNAVMGFSRSLAMSLAPEVRVNCIAPGWIRTAWGEQAGEIWQQRVLAETPLKRWGTPEDIARFVRYLVSEDAAYLTGQVYYVNGGAER